MRMRILALGLAAVAVGLSSGCSCRKFCCRPACPPAVAASPCCPPSPAPCCPPGGAAVAPQGTTQFFSGPPVGVMGSGH